MRSMKSPLVIYAAVVALTAVVFIIDLRIPLGVADWLGYLLLLFTAAQLFQQPEEIYAFAIACTVLMAIGLVMSPPGLSMRLSIMNRTAAAFVLLITAFISAQRKKTENKLKTSETKYRIVADNTYDWEFWLSPQGKFLYTSPSSERVTGHSAHEFEANPELLSHIIYPDDFQRFIEHHHEAGKSGSLEFRVRRPDGSVRWIEHLCQPVYDDDGRYLGHRGSNRDVTERKNIEQQRADLNAMITHDLKSPLTSILVYSELLIENKRELSDNEAKDMVAAINKSGNKLLGMVEDFLSISRLENVNLTLKTHPENLTESLRDVQDDIAIIASQKGLTFKTEIQEGMPEVAIDKKLVQRAVSNLLQNAVNYTPAGGNVTLKAECVTGPDDDFIVISVTDTGLGVPKEEQDRIFDKYYRSSITGGVRGSGLGLAIVKAVAKAHGGRVELNSELGHGSTFKIFLPIASGNHRG
jgi:PAS domain S-box-containing protein